MGEDDACETEEAAPVTNVGVNYLEVCRNTQGPEAPYARAALEGIEAVLEKRQDEFHMIYPCAWPAAEGRLEVLDFLLSVSPLKDGGGAVVAHHEIPKQRLESNG